jgi:hypothetical protein
MIPRTAIVQIAKKIGRELNSGAEASEDALAAGPILAEAGVTPEIVGQLLAEAQRNRPNDRMIQAYAFMLEGALGTLRVQASGGDVGADHTIAAVGPVPGRSNESDLLPALGCPGLCRAPGIEDR